MCTRMYDGISQEKICLLYYYYPVRRVYRRSRSIGVLFSRDLCLIRASPQLLIELWNCIPIRDVAAGGGGGGGGGGEER